MHILVVEDEPKVASFIRRGLEAEHYEVEVVHDGATGLRRALGTDYDLVILDVMLPGCNGLEVLRELRARGRSVPILLLTARAGLSDKVSGLDLGADDYLTKHLANCSRCRGACESLKRTLALCHSVPSAQVPESVQQSVRASIRRLLASDGPH